jgi:hypothetical protein
MVEVGRADDAPQIHIVICFVIMTMCALGAPWPKLSAQRVQRALSSAIRAIFLGLSGKLSQLCGQA